MKLNAVSTNTTRQDNTNNQNKKNVHFKGLADSATVFWNFVDAGGRGLQFTVEDMFGTNFPRTYQGAKAGYEYTGKINWPSVWQEAIREFLTGPTMTLAPIAILAIATKMTGETANTHIENILNLSHLTSTLGIGDKPNEELFKNSYIETVVKDILKNSTTEKIKQKDIDAIIDGINNYSNAQAAIKKAKEAKLPRAIKKQRKKEAAKVLDDLGLTFEKILKRNNKNYTNLDFQTAKYTIGMKNGKPIQGQTGFKNYVKYITAFKDDYINKNTCKNDAGEKLIDLSKNTLDGFKKTWVGKRALIITSMIALTGVIMSIIPKLYTLASGSVNPNAANIYNEAKKREAE